MIYEYTRTERLIGREGMQKLFDASVMVFGIGGVGSHCIEALARSGVGRLILIDHDTVSLTNLNRQSIAYHSTIGQPKTKVMKDRIADINPRIQVTTYEQFVLPGNLENFFTEHVDYVVDAIDTVTAKLAIAELTQNRKIPLISSMGTGNKLHPELFEFADIFETSVCPLCKVMRRELKKRGVSRLKVLYSREKPVDVSKDESGEENGTKRPVPGSVSFVPPVAGLLIAGEVIRELSGISDLSHH